MFGRRALNVLFVCRQNAGRSQMAAGFAGRVAGIEPRSAGMLVADRDGEPIPASVIDVMAEVAVDLDGLVRTQLSADMVEWADVVVVIAPETELSSLLEGAPVERWDVADPKGQPDDVLRAARDRVGELVDEFAARNGLRHRRLLP